MNVGDAFAYAAMLASMTLAPGPLVVMLMARALGGDEIGAVGFGVGVAIGDVLAIVAVLWGLAAFLESTPEIFAVGRVLAAAYIGWIAVCLWRGGGVEASGSSGAGLGCGFAPAVAAGAAACLISPQTLILYTLLLPQLLDVSAVGVGDFIKVAALTFATLAFCFMVVVTLAARMKRLIGRPGGAQGINRALACVVAATGVWIAAG